MSVSYSGELAYELHLPNEQLKLAFDLLLQPAELYSLGAGGGH